MNYQATGKLIGYIPAKNGEFQGTNSLINFLCLIEIKRNEQYVVSLYTSGASEWESGVYYSRYSDAIDGFLLQAKTQCTFSDSEAK